MARRRAVPQRSQMKVTPAPVGGLNARDSLAEMPPDDAVTLDNFFPAPTSVNLRNGRVDWLTGIAAHVESLMPYRSATAQKLFAAAGTAFYDATTQGVVGAAVVSGLTNARWQHANFGTAGGQFLMAVNGADKLRGYNGTTWWADGDGAHDITGVDTATCAHINVFKNRVYLTQKDSFKVWYLPLSSIAGVAASFDLSPLFKLGGYLMGMVTFTIDDSSGTQEYACFVSSEGEIAMYQGSDPTNAGTWALAGMFRMGRPIGRRFYEKFGSDIIMISADGFMPLSKALLTDRVQAQDAISYKIVNLVNNDVQSYAANFGWQVLLHPIGNKLIINVPQLENSMQYQYVMNTVTGAWCRFTNWNANCWALLGDAIYYGGNLGVGANSAFVSKADIGFADAGAYVFGEAKPAFQYFGAPGYLKKMNMVAPVLDTAGNLNIVLGMDANFGDSYPTGTPSFSGVGGTAWGAGLWNTFPWGDISNVRGDWQTVSAEGDALALHMRVVNNKSALKWTATKYLFELGGALG